jgi:hypothetical protein
MNVDIQLLALVQVSCIRTSWDTPQEDSFDVQHTIPELPVVRSWTSTSPFPLIFVLDRTGRAGISPCTSERGSLVWLRGYKL